MHKLSRPMCPSPLRLQPMLPKRLGTSVSTSCILESVVLTKLDKAPGRSSLPLVLPGESGVEAGSLNLPDNEKERVTQGYGNNTQDKGKGKRVERSKLHDD